MLVVGGGAVATRRVPALLASEAQVVIVSPELTPALHALAADGRIVWHARPFTPSDVDGSWLVQVAVDDPEAARAVSAAAEERRVFCVRADDRHAATAWTPATTRHGPVTVAVTAGGDPRRAMAVRDAIHDLLAASELTGGPGAEGTHSLTGQDSPSDASNLTGDRRGSVALVGGGPGDPELITVKGRRLLAAADVVVADRLAPGLLLDELRPEVELIDASKIPYGPAATQEEINRLLVERARAGRFVVRLKGGDPYVFGRGGEEVLACAEAGVPVTLVPGVTSAIAAPADGRDPGDASRRGARTGRRLRPPSARASGVPCGLAGRGAIARHDLHPHGIDPFTRNRSDAARARAGARRPGRRGAGRYDRIAARGDGPLWTTIAAETAAQGLRPPAVVVIGACDRCP